VDGARERQLIDELEDLLARGTTAMAPEIRHEPSAGYTDAARQARERALLFRRRPLVVATTAELPQPGDFTTSAVAGLPVLTVRGDDGRVRCLVNICRHRGNQVCLEESGNRRVFYCDYHAWTYDRAGTLRSPVDREGFAGLPDGLGLVELPTQERHGLVWTVPTADAELDVAAYAGPELDREIADLGLAGFTLHARTVAEQPFNWKLGVDTFLEVFHLAYLHKKTVGPFFVGNTGAYTEWGPHHRFTAVRTSFAGMLQKSPDEQSVYPHSSIVHLVFPNTILTWQMDHVETWRFYPATGRDDACVVEGAMLVPPAGDRQAPATDSARRHWERNWSLLLTTIFEEDFPTMARVQRNLETGAVPELAFGRNEVALQHFHAALDEALHGAVHTEP
jgi:phenylpropionate dioxygenase-like ring-hydroxylating dioxygenase large terminal subunit